MKIAKVIGILFVVVGVVFALLGIIRCYFEFNEDGRIYTTAYIIRIDERETGDSEFPIEYTTYVELEVNGEKILTKLNTYSSSFEIGKQVGIYYFENDLQMVYKDRSDVFYIIFALVGVLFAILGATIYNFQKKNISPSP